LANPVMHVHVKEGAKLRYIVVGQWGNGTSAVPTVHARVEKDAHFQMLFVGLSGELCKSFVESDIVGEGAKSEVLGVVMAHGRQHYDIDVQQNHRTSNTVSDVLFHVALTDRSRSIFGGNILCEPGSQKIDGYQQNRNLMLSDKARADSMPRLEIEANDVRCTHGASFSTYDQDQKFYLQSRGLNQAEAEQLLVTGFFSAVLDRLEHETAAEWLEGLMTEKMTHVLRKGR
jgi:Fe-S cluster assembly protein SufD